MAEIEIGPLSDRLGDDEIADLAGKMERLGAPQLPRADESHAAPVSDAVDDDALTEFLDRLDGHDVAADIYLPIEFDGVIEVGELRVASAAVLLEILDEVKDEIDAEAEEEAEDDDFEDDGRAAELRHIWRLFSDGAQAALERKLPLLLKT